MTVSDRSSATRRIKSLIVFKLFPWFPSDTSACKSFRNKVKNTGDIIQPCRNPTEHDILLVKQDEVFIHVSHLHMYSLNNADYFCTNILFKKLLPQRCSIYPIKRLLEVNE